jgi:hypothetical protein
MYEASANLNLFGFISNWICYELENYDMYQGHRAQDLANESVRVIQLCGIFGKLGL